MADYITNVFNLNKHLLHADLNFDQSVGCNIVVQDAVPAEVDDGEVKDDAFDIEDDNAADFSEECEFTRRAIAIKRIQDLSTTVGQTQILVNIDMGEDQKSVKKDIFSIATPCEINRWIGQIDLSKRIMIDGPSCVGKTTMITSIKKCLMRFVKGDLLWKYNDVSTFTKQGSYNIYPVASLNYYISSVHHMYTSGVCDRSPISNLAYGIVYAIRDEMAYGDVSVFGSLGLENVDHIYNKIKALAIPKINAYYSTFRHFMSCSLQTNLFIVVDSDLTALTTRLMCRAAQNCDETDVIRSFEEVYHMIQTVVFSEIGRVLNAAVIDIRGDPKSLEIITARFELFIATHSSQLVVNKSLHGPDADTIVLPDLPICDLQYKYSGK